MRRSPAPLVTPVLLTLLALMTTAVGACSAESPVPGGDRSPRSPTSPTEVEDVLADGPRPPSTPGEAARVLVAATRVVDDAGSSADELAVAGHAEQLAVREAARRPAWDDRVARRLPPPLRADLRDNVAARRALRSMHPTRPSDLATELPAWRIVTPPPAERLRRWYVEAERRHGVDWEVLAAVHLVETVFGRIRGTSSAGAQGPMQFLPPTWDLYGQGGDIHDHHDAILAAARLLEANGFATDPGGALRHYNDHPAYVEGVLRHAAVMKRRPSALLGYHAWQVHYLTRSGYVWLEEGYAERRPVPVDDHLREHPDALR